MRNATLVVYFLESIAIFLQKYTLFCNWPNLFCGMAIFMYFCSRKT